MTREYREFLRRRAPYDDIAFAEYVCGLVLPDHLAEVSKFADHHGSAVILLPRGHGKTTLFDMRTARLIGVTRGRVRVLVLAAVADDAEARSGEIRRIVESERFAEVFPWARGGVKGAVWSDRRWSVAGTEALHGKDSTCRAEGLLSVRPGARADILLADDIVGEQEVTTPAMRAKVLTTYRSVVDPILVPDSPALREALAADPALGLELDPDGTFPSRRWVLGTRWHVDDPYGAFIAGGWPALVRTAIGPDGQALWPDLWPVEKLEAKRIELGSAIFNLQYQNDPSGMGGNIFRREWFRYVDEVPAGARRGGVDLNASSSERADYTAAVEWVEDDKHNLYMVGAYTMVPLRRLRSWTHRPAEYSWSSYRLQRNPPVWGVLVVAKATLTDCYGATAWLASDVSVGSVRSQSNDPGQTSETSWRLVSAIQRSSVGTRSATRTALTCQPSSSSCAW